MYLQFKKITYAWRGGNYDLPLLSRHLELDSDISLSHGPLTVGIMLDSYGLVLSIVPPEKASVEALVTGLWARAVLWELLVLCSLAH